MKNPHAEREEHTPTHFHDKKAGTSVDKFGPSEYAQNDNHWRRSNVVLACVVFLAEVCVVTLCTLRTIFISRGCKYLAPFLGFFEVAIWLIAMAQIMRKLDDWSLSLAYALGFTLGNYLGVLIEKALALGTVNVHVITQRNSTLLLHGLRGANFGATCVQGQGTTGPVNIIMAVIRRKQLARILVA